MAVGFGKIDFALACRLGELTQNEMRVLIYLYACRNQETLQCNPRRKTICDDAKIEKGNLSKAIAGLEEKCWILENEIGNFYLFEAAHIPKKVVEATTKVVEVTTPKVVEATTKVVEVTTKVVEVTTESCRSYNSLNKDMNREGTEKEQRSAAPVFKSFAQNKLVAETESVIKFSVNLLTSQRIEEVVPINLKNVWLEMVRNRMVGNEDKHPSFLKTRIGYWLQDFQRENKRELEKTKHTGTEEPSPDEVKNEREKYKQTGRVPPPVPV